MYNVKRYFSFLFLLILEPVFAHFTVEATLRPHFEYQYGFKTLLLDKADPATSHRTRLNFGYNVGSPIDNIGMIDLSGNASLALNNKSRIILNFHKFFAASKIDDDISKDLGFEIDLVTSHPKNKFMGIDAGYSRFFASSGIEYLKENYDGNCNNWALTMIPVNPIVFTWQENKTINN